MNANARSVKARENWIKCYQELGSVSKAALKCGVPRSTIYRWVKRFKETGKDSLVGQSKRPKHLAKQKVTDELVALIVSIRNLYKFGPQGISTHLLREHGIEISDSSVWRVLKKKSLPNLKRYKRKDSIIRYSKDIPGERVQMDVTKIGPKCYQFTAVDNCTRLRTLRLCHNKKAESTVEFLGHVLDTFLFPIHRMQTKLFQYNGLNIYHFGYLKYL